MISASALCSNPVSCLDSVSPDHRPSDPGLQRRSPSVTRAGGRPGRRPDGPGFVSLLSRLWVPGSCQYGYCARWCRFMRSSPPAVWSGCPRRADNLPARSLSRGTAVPIAISPPGAAVWLEIWNVIISSPFGTGLVWRAHDDPVAAARPIAPGLQQALRTGLHCWPRLHWHRYHGQANTVGRSTAEQAMRKSHRTLSR